MTARISSPVFVGRTAELERLVRSFEAARGGDPAAILVSGEAGIGKSRLVREAVGAAEAAGFLVLTGRCQPLADDPIPFGPITEAARSLREHLGDAVLGDLVGEWRLDLVALMPWLAAEPAATSGSNRGRLFELSLAFLERAAARQPIVLVIEDLHWADRSSVDLLSFLVRNRRSTPLAVVATVRTGELDRTHPVARVIAELERGGDLARVDLLPLDHRAIAAQLSALGGHEADDVAVDRVFARSGGNPFFAEELAAAEPGGLPSTLRDLLLARVDALSAETRTVLRVAAIGGPELSTAVIARVLDRPEAELRPSFREAVDGRVLMPDPALSLGGYRFRHALFQEAIVSDQLADERRALHAAVADALAAVSADGSNGLVARASVAAALAFHWTEAGDEPHAFAAHVAAGLAAEEMSAFPEAERHFRQAVELHDRHPTLPVPAGLDVAELHARIARAAAAGGSPGHAVAEIRRAIALVNGDADPIRLGLLNLSLSRYLGQVAVGPEMVEAAREAARLVPEDPPSADRAKVLAHLSSALLVGQQHEEAFTASDDAIAAARAVGARGPEARALITRAMCAGFFGDADAAVAACVEARDLALTVGDPDITGAAYWNLAYMQGILARRWGDAIATCLEGFAESQRVGRVLENGGGRDLLGSAAYCAWAAGRWPQADELLDRARDLGAEGVETSLGFLYHDVRALLALARGNFAEAARRIDALRRLSGENDDTSTVSELGRVPAELAVLERRVADASDLMDRALERLDAIGATADADILGEVLMTGAFVEAEAAADARARRDASALDAAFERGSRYVERLRAVHVELARTQPARLRVSSAFLLAAEAELGRLMREPADWASAAGAWHDLDEPYREAWAWYRDAEAILARSRRRAAAEGSLRRAQEIALRLGATVLLGEIEQLARRARIGIQPSPEEVDGTTEPAANAGPGLRLTKREREVLQLLADGWTNREIGAHLFITEKTAGVHVSNILGKVGALRRTEAVAIARRAGLV